MVPRLLLNVDTTVMPFMQQGNLVQVAAAFLDRRPNDLARLGGRERVSLGRFLLGSQIVVKQNASGPVRTLSSTIRLPVSSDPEESFTAVAQALQDQRAQFGERQRYQIPA
jgi:hypothetical protein